MIMMGSEEGVAGREDRRELYAVLWPVVGGGVWPIPDAECEGCEGGRGLVGGLDGVDALAGIAGEDVLDGLGVEPVVDVLVVGADGEGVADVVSLGLEELVVARVGVGVAAVVVAEPKKEEYEGIMRT